MGIVFSWWVGWRSVWIASAHILRHTQQGLAVALVHCLERCEKIGPLVISWRRERARYQLLPRYPEMRSDPLGPLDGELAESVPEIEYLLLADAQVVGQTRVCHIGRTHEGRQIVGVWPFGHKVEQ